MIGIKQLRLATVQPGVARPHRWVRMGVVAKFFVRRGDRNTLPLESRDADRSLAWPDPAGMSLHCHFGENSFTLALQKDASWSSICVFY